MSDLKDALKATASGEGVAESMDTNTSVVAARKKPDNKQIEARKAPSRRGTDQVTVFLDKRAKTQLQFLKIEESTTIQALMEEAVNDLFAKYKKPEIAARK